LQVVLVIEVLVLPAIVGLAARGVGHMVGLIATGCTTATVLGLALVGCLQRMSRLELGLILTLVVPLVATGELSLALAQTLAGILVLLLTPV